MGDAVAVPNTTWMENGYENLPDPEKLRRSKATFATWVRQNPSKTKKSFSLKAKGMVYDPEYKKRMNRLVSALVTNIQTQLDPTVQLNQQIAQLQQQLAGVPHAQQAAAAIQQLQDQLAQRVNITTEKANVIQLFITATREYAAFKALTNEEQQNAENAAAARTALNNAIIALNALTDEQMPEAEREAYAFGQQFLDELPVAGGGARRRKSRKANRKSQRKSRKGHRKSRKGSRQ